MVLEKTLEIPLDCKEIKPVDGKRNSDSYLLIYTYMLVPKSTIAPHSSTLAWKIPWMAEPGGLQSMQLLRVRHD